MNTVEVRIKQSPKEITYSRYKIPMNSRRIDNLSYRNVSYRNIDPMGTVEARMKGLRKMNIPDIDFLGLPDAQTT